MVTTKEHVTLNNESGRRYMAGSNYTCRYLTVIVLM